MVNFLLELNENEIESYKENLCKVDCTKVENDLEVAQEIWKMTANIYHLVQSDYSKVDGLKMLQKGLLRITKLTM